MTFSHCIVSPTVQVKLSGKNLIFCFLTLILYRILRLVQIESIFRQQNEFDLKTEILFGMGRKHWGRWRKWSLPAFSPFHPMFSRGIFFRVVKSRDCVKELNSMI